MSGGDRFPCVYSDVQAEGIEVANLPSESHHGIFQTVTTIQSGALQQDKTAWAKESGNTVEKGDYFFFCRLSALP